MPQAPQHSTAMPADEPPPPPDWLELPEAVLKTKILEKLGTRDLLATAQVCTSWRSLCKDPTMWRSIHMCGMKDSRWGPKLEAMCRQAVDRSGGGCVDFSINNFGSDELLKYTIDRCNHIRRLRLVCCNDISDECLSEAATKLPMLEVLELSYCSFSKEALETVGQCCPLLKSFKLNSQGYGFPHIICDDEAQAIAKNMHGLRHLQLFGNKMTNEGLEAILDGCPHLEYLDLRQCFSVNMGGDLGTRCTEQIKDLRRPYDPTDDYEFDATIHDDDSFFYNSPSGYSVIDLPNYDNNYEFSDFDDVSLWAFNYDFTG